MKQKKTAKGNSWSRARAELQLMGGKSAEKREKKIKSTYQRYYVGNPTVELVVKLRRREAIKQKVKRFFGKFKRK